MIAPADWAQKIVKTEKLIKTIIKEMSKIRTLKDLPNNSEAFGFTVERKHNNKC